VGTGDGMSHVGSKMYSNLDLRCLATVVSVEQVVGSGIRLCTSRFC
jgi:hypothetical protein